MSRRRTRKGSRRRRSFIFWPFIIFLVLGVLGNFLYKGESTRQDAAPLSSVSAYSGVPSATVDGNIPYFSDADLTTTSYTKFGDLDSLGRCTAATACIGQDLLPTDSRGTIGMVKPTGWHLVKYDGIDGNYLYNRCHLIAYELSGENSNEKNLITGTRYLNIEGMLPYENKVADYVKSTGNHVMYRVTPIFEGDNLLASGVLMEGESVEDGGNGVKFCIYSYNVQPGITIDYATGDSSGQEYTGSETAEYDGVDFSSLHVNAVALQALNDAGYDSITYVVNTNTGKFHYPNCPSVSTIADHNRIDSTETRDQLIAEGYQPCKRCNP